METQTRDPEVKRDSAEILDDLITAAVRIESEVATVNFAAVFSAYVTARYGVVFVAHQQLFLP